MTQQLKAAYLCDAVLKIFQQARKNETDRPSIEGLLKYASAFDVKWPEGTAAGSVPKMNPLLAVAHNLVCRGLPTRAPLLVETTLEKVGLVKPNRHKYKYDYEVHATELDLKTAMDLLHFIEPGRNPSRAKYDGELGSRFEWQFLDEQLAEWPFAKQILQSQREFASINGADGGGRKVDFSYAFPQHSTVAGYPYGSTTVGVVFEVDGPHHETLLYKAYDRYRDDEALNQGFNTIRTPSLHDEVATEKLTTLFSEGDFDRLRRNFSRSAEKNLAEYTITLVPIVVARIQRTVIAWLLQNPTAFTQAEVNIAVIERDLPGAALAITQLQSVLDNLTALMPDENKVVVPRITLHLFPEREWTYHDALHLATPQLSSADFTPANYHLIIDHSILRRSGLIKESTFLTERATMVRSAHFYDTQPRTSRRTYCAQPIVYQPLVTRQDDGSYTERAETTDAINYFLRNIFRKKKFREGQLPIISRALQQRAVIGLLPTGGGKSITFQLSALLQPGLCLIVDPIKSLMEDQVRVLKENWIDNCAFINSNLSREEKQKAMTDHTYGESQFFFVSPERLVMTEFRQMVERIDFRGLGLAYAYCVIDEVHCVSEWGHDFRTTYLMLGKNAQRFVHTKTNSPVPLIGLTATASFDVLADIERELKIETEDEANAVITLENTVRPELFFRVVSIGDETRIAALNRDFANLTTNLAQLNQPGILRSAQEHYQNELEGIPLNEEELSRKVATLRLPEEILARKSQNDHCAIVFCPVKGKGGNELGVDYVYQNINSNSKGYYYSDEDAYVDGPNTDIARSFMEFTEGDLKHIVCTKAFGMGIDKEDIRATYHFNYSSSLESFVQEAGRSGRDKKVAEAVVLISENESYGISYRCLQYEHPNDYAPTNPEKNFSPISGFWNRKNISQQLLRQDFSTIERARQSIREVVDQFRYTTEETKESIIQRLSDWIEPTNPDKSIHDFFHSKSYSGVNTEKQQMFTLFKELEFPVADVDADRIDVDQGTLEDEFNKCKNGTFFFVLTEKKTYRSKVSEIASLLGVEPGDRIAPNNPRFTRTFGEGVTNAYKYAKDFQDYLINLSNINESISVLFFDKIRLRRLKHFYNYPRDSNATGRLIYRMHSAGLLEDYTIDYQRGSMHACTLRKYDSITDYHLIIEQYLRRYLSEIVATKKMAELRERCNRDTLTSNLLQCLYFLAEFAYTEIADKRKRATEEIDRVMRTCIRDEDLRNNPQRANEFIKEEIYYYFNAKYARVGFRIGDTDYSLLEDHRNPTISRAGLLRKYLVALNIEGSQQNNYKHLIGSCKKIIRSLGASDLKREWALLLLQSFAMYAVNNASYVSEANGKLITGFRRLYEDVEFHKNDLATVEHHFIDYFDRLKENIKPENPSFRDIEAIRLSLLFELQSKMISQLQQLS